MCFECSTTQYLLKKGLVMYHKCMQVEAKAVLRQAHLATKYNIMASSGLIIKVTFYIAHDHSEEMKIIFRASLNKTIKLSALYPRNSLLLHSKMTHFHENSKAVTSKLPLLKGMANMHIELVFRFTT